MISFSIVNKTTKMDVDRSGGRRRRDDEDEQDISGMSTKGLGRWS